MANADRPRGFMPIKHLNGSPWNGQTNIYYIFSTYGTAVFPGDIVKLSGEADARGIPSIELAGADGLPVGVVVSIVPNPVIGLDYKYSPASTEGYALIADSPDIIMIAQEDGTMTVGETGENTKPTGAAGSTRTGHSQDELNFSEAGSTNTLMLKMLRLYDVEDNDLGADAVMECKFNRHAHSVDTGATAT